MHLIYMQDIYQVITYVEKEPLVAKWPFRRCRVKGCIDGGWPKYCETSR